jgi:nitroreductase
MNKVAMTDGFKKELKMPAVSIRFPDSAEPDSTMSFQEAARSRYSVRRFLSTPVPDEIIRQVLKDAHCSPSNCNTQPWNVHVVSGAKRAELSRAILAKNEAGEFSYDFSFDMNEYYGCYADRKNEFGKGLYEGMNIAREEKATRENAANNNYSFFNAPHVAFLFMPTFGDSVRVGGDLGMYGQTFLLSLAARGLGGIPQTSLGFFAGTIREVLNVPEHLKLLYGISFGVPDETAPGSLFRSSRASLEETVTFHR